MNFVARNIKIAIIVLGFISSVAGTLGSFLLIEGLGNQVKALQNQRSAAVGEIDRLGALTNQYFIANQQGDLIYTLGLQQVARRDIVQLIYQGNVLDRAEPVRNLIGALAIAGLLDYRKTYGAYEKLSDEARRSQEYGPFLEVKKAEREVVERAQERVANLQQGLIPLQQQTGLLEAQLRGRQRLLLAFSLIGASLFLCANLIEQKARQAERGAPAA